ncbi:MAG: lysozyme [Terriglobales bacterium]
MTYLDLASSLVKRLEGCRLTGYADSVGKPTNGYGHTGPEVRVGATISQEIADHDLDIDLATADRRLSGVCSQAALGGLHDHQRAALVSFVFNVGADASWTIWRDIDAGHLADVPAQLRRFVHGRVGGQLVEIAGLEHRREAEIVYWNTADIEAAVAVTQTPNAVPAPPSGLTREIETPPAPLPAPPLAKASLTTKIVTCVSGLCAAAGTAGTQVHDIVAPHAADAHIFAALATGATGVVVAASIVALLIHGRQAQQRTV